VRVLIGCVSWVGCATLFESHEMFLFRLSVGCTAIAVLGGAGVLLGL